MSESQLGSEEVKTIESPSPSSTTSGQATSSEEQPSSRAKGDSRVHRTAAQVVLLGAFGLDMLLYSLVIPFLPGEAQGLGASPLVTGALFAMYAAGIFAATPLAAWFTDHLGPRRTLLWGLLALAASTLLFAFSPTLALGLPGLFVARASQGIASALAWTAGLAVLVQLYSAEERPRLFARAFTVTGLAVLIGPPLGGALYTLGGFTLPFMVATGLVVL
ncbi:MAG TPA: MFS transporter, partial [Ktedonobacterales bacterium]|nr:MFS transporter [Ktedonobacterales bacterium]